MRAHPFAANAVYQYSCGKDPHFESGVFEHPETTKKGLFSGTADDVIVTWFTKRGCIFFPGHPVHNVQDTSCFFDFDTQQTVQTSEKGSVALPVNNFPSGCQSFQCLGRSFHVYRHICAPGIITAHRNYRYIYLVLLFAIQ